MTEGIKGKILLIKLSSLGDVIFNIPLANSLKKAGYSVTWLVGEKGYDVIKNNPCVNDVILAPFVKWKKSGFSFREYFSILKKIRDEKFDISIDTQGRFKSLIFNLFCGAKRRIAGSDGKEFSKFGANEIVPMGKKNFDVNVVEKYLDFAKYLDAETDITDMSLPQSEKKDIESVDNMLKGINKPIAVLCPQTTWVTKHWDKKNWIELTEKISDRFSLVFTGTDYDFLESINNGQGLNLAGKTNLKELIEIFRRSDLIISLDSGSTHLARAAHAKAIISIFCSTPEKYYAPIGENYISFGGKLECRPCHKRKCKNNTLACTRLPNVEEVLSAVDKLTEKEN